MTPRELVSAVSPVLKWVMVAFAIGIAWADLRSQVNAKAEKTDVVAMAEDIRDIKAILCGQVPRDSYCRARGDRR